MKQDEYQKAFQEWLESLVRQAQKNQKGALASYIPELAQVDPEQCAISVMFTDGLEAAAGDVDHVFSLQSVSKLIVLIGLLEEVGLDQVQQWINFEPSGQPFSSLAHLDLKRPLPANPMVNTGAIALVSRIPGNTQERLAWIHRWCQRLFGEKLTINEFIFASEMKTGHRNRSIAYLLKSNAMLPMDVEEVLHTYFSCCSLDANITQAVRLPMLLASGGFSPSRERILSPTTCHAVVSIMATCGLYDESGHYLMETGLPAKSGVSGLMVAVATGRAGIAVCSPRLNHQGGSVRGRWLLHQLAQQQGWHFAAPWPYHWQLKD